MHRYTLEPYNGIKSRYDCPLCNRRHTLSRYIDTNTGEHIGTEVGRCSRQINCGYHYKPSAYFSKNGLPQDRDSYRPLTYQQIAQTSYLPAKLLQQSLKGYQHNHLMQYLAKRFGNKAAYEQAKRYLIGSAKHWPGASIFWQVDTEGRIRTGKIMLYDAESGKRVKQPFNHITWVHSLLSRKSGVDSRESKAQSQKYKVENFRSGLTQDLQLKTSDLGLRTQDFKTKQCLFGEHLLPANPDMPVAICESEKSALMAAICYPQLLWLASGSLFGLTAGKCKCLHGRKVLLVPDVNAYEQWNQKATELSAAMPSAKFTVMQLLESNSTSDEAGWDIADFL
jgi:hypothetical protein